MIDENKLVKDIFYSNKWNNAKCPDWVISLIYSQQQKDTPAKKHAHVMVSDVLNSNNTVLNVNDVIRYTAQLFGSPCAHMRGTIDVSDEMRHRYPYWCCSQECKKHSPLECWRKYFELRKEEEWGR